jgi:hypothetical protein
MTRTERIDQAQDCLTVAASGMITDYSDVRVRGYLKEHPAFVAYRLGLLEHAIAAVRRQAAAEEMKWGPDEAPPAPAEIDAEHHELVAEFAAHSCNCEWCLHGGGGPAADPDDGLGSLQQWLRGNWDPDEPPASLLADMREADPRRR